MPVTIDDLSRRLGLSPSTVSKALNGRHDVAETTRHRVQRVALEMGYQPSATARNLRRQRTDKIGLVFNYPIHVVGDFISELIPGMAAVAESAHYNFILYTQGLDNPDRVQDLCRSREVDGIILAWPPDAGRTRTIVDIMQRENMPCVLLPRRVSHSDVSYIAADHTSGGRTLTEHLIKLGHRRIAFIGLPEVHETDTDRRAGYFQALVAAGIDRDPSLMIDIRLSDKNAVKNAMQHLLNLDEPPTAIELFTDRMAMRALAATRLWGIRVPEDLSIAGFDGILASGISTPGITTVRQPIEQMGTLAAESLLSLMANSDQPPAQHVLPVNLIMRGSTGPASSKQRA